MGVKFENPNVKFNDSDFRTCIDKNGKPLLLVAKSLSISKNKTYHIEAYRGMSGDKAWMYYDNDKRDWADLDISPYVGQMEFYCSTVTSDENGETQDPFASIVDITVNDDERGKGIADLLFSYAMDIITKNHGINKIGLEAFGDYANRTNTLGSSEDHLNRLVRWYREYGFSKEEKVESEKNSYMMRYYGGPYKSLDTLDINSEKIYAPVTPLVGQNRSAEKDSTLEI